MTITELRSLLTSGRAALFLDGLDQVLVSLSVAERKSLVRRLLEQPLANGCSAVLTCRTHLFESMADAYDLTSGLSTALSHLVDDRTAETIQRLLDPQAQKGTNIDSFDVVSVSLWNLSEADVDRYMAIAGTGDQWRSVKTIGGLRDLAQRPVLLFLLSKVVNSLSTASLSVSASNVTVSWLYETAVKLWLRRDPVACGLDESRVFSYLESQAEELWKGEISSWPILGRLSPIDNWIGRGRRRFHDHNSSQQYRIELK